MNWINWSPDLTLCGIAFICVVVAFGIVSIGAIGWLRERRRERIIRRIIGG